MNLGAKKKIISDMILNIIATAIPVFVLQLIILPRIAIYVDDEKYGFLVTILSLLNIVPSTMGNALNNIRLIKEKKAEVSSDYNIILLILIFVNLIIVSTFMFIYKEKTTVWDLILTLMVSILWLAREYFIVAFRIVLNYKYIVICNAVMVFGYGIGYTLFLCTHNWQYIYIFGFVVSMIFIFSKSRLWKEPLKFTNRFKDITVQTALLFFSNLLTRVTTYADKMMIFPLLGGSVVSVYYTATLFGKVVSMAITPVSSVILSYLSKSTQKNNKVFGQAFSVSMLVCLVGYFICVIISRPILTLLYPQFATKALHYIFVTTGTVVITALIAIINPFVLKFFDMRWQVLINLSYVIVYIVISLAFLYFGGLMGFCIGALVSTILKLFFMIIVYLRCKEKKLNEEDS